MSKKYQRLKRQISNDNGITWSDMDGVYKVGNEMGGAECIPRIYRTVQADPSIFECAEGNKYYVNEVQYSDNNGLTWTTEYQTRGEIMEELSEDCGVAYRWVDVDGEYICEEGSNVLSSTTVYYIGRNISTGAIESVTKTVTSLTDCSSYFVEDTSLPNTLEMIELFEFPDTKNVTSMANMFFGCNRLTDIHPINSFNLRNCSTVDGMFQFCESLTSLTLNSWNTSKVTSTAYMFNGCTSLTSLDLSGWDLYNVQYMNYMFSRCKNLENLYLDGWKIRERNTPILDVYHLFNECTQKINIFMRGCDDYTISVIEGEKPASAIIITD